MIMDDQGRKYYFIRLVECHPYSHDIEPIIWLFQTPMLNSQRLVRLEDVTSGTNSTQSTDTGGQKVKDKDN